MNIFDQLKCVVFQVFKFSALPKEFLELIKITKLKSVGASVGGYIAKIARDFRFNYVTKNINHVTNLGICTRKGNIVANSTVKLKTLVDFFCTNL